MMYTGDGTPGDHYKNLLQYMEYSKKNIDKLDQREQQHMTDLLHERLESMKETHGDRRIDPDITCSEDENRKCAE